MKKLLFLILFIFVFSATHAQVSFSVGAKGGANFSTASIKDVSLGENSIIAYHVGTFFMLRFPSMAIQPEVLFSKQGTDLNDFKIDLSYVNIPLIVKFYIGKSLNLHLGPQFGFLTDAAIKDLSNNSLPDLVDNVGDAFEASELSGIVGAGLDLKSGWQLSVRYVFGLKDVNNSSTFKNSFKNRMLQASVGFRLFKCGK